MIDLRAILPFPPRPQTAPAGIRTEKPLWNVVGQLDYQPGFTSLDNFLQQVSWIQQPKM
jgi:hypothetical protein